MSALDAILAPPVIPDPTDAAYREALDILEDHPDTRGMDFSRRASLAQQIVDAIGGVWWDSETLEQQREEAYEGFKELLSRPKAPKYIRDAAPTWVTDEYDVERALMAAKTPQAIQAAAAQYQAVTA